MSEQTALTTTNLQAGIMERVLVGGDLGALQPAERLAYYRAVCESVGLNPLTKPFDYIKLGGRLVLYARKDATDQLRKIHRVSITKLERADVNGVHVVTVYAKDGEDRQDVATGAVSLGNLKGDALANALMKAETKAKRRVTLSICGMGWLDETEVSTIPEAAHVVVDEETGEIIDERPVGGNGNNSPPPGPRQPAKQSKKASIAPAIGMQWNAKATELAQRCPHYQANDKPNFDHMLTAAAQLGYTEITADNLGQVIRELADRVEA
jgi:hypothetical protein